MVEVNGKSFKISRIVIVMMVSTKMIRKMDMVYLLGKVVTSIRVIIKMMKETATVKCFGLMAHTIKVNGAKVSNMVKVK